MKLRAAVYDGKLNVDWEKVKTYLSRMKDGTLIDFELVRHQKTESNPLRKYYFSTVLPPFMGRLGYERDEDELFHRQLKITYFRIKPDKKGIYRKVPSVFGKQSKIPVPIKRKFVDWVIRKAAQEGVVINDPM